MEALSSSTTAAKLSHAKAQSVTVNRDGTIELKDDAEQLIETLQLTNLIVIIDAPQENGSVKDDYLLLSIEDRTSTSTPDSPDKDSSNHEYSLKVSVTKALPPELIKYHVQGLPSHLTLPKDDLYVVVSTLSGACDAARFFEGVFQPALAAVGVPPINYTIHHTTSDHSIKDLAAQDWIAKANKGRAQTIILLSGDGGVVDTINGLFEGSRSSDYIKPTVGLLALGTGNALANSSGLNSDSTKGLASLLQGSPRQVPLFQARFSTGAVLLTHEGQQEEPLHKDSKGHGTIHGAVVASWGLHASLVADSDTTEYRKFGSERFSMAAKELLGPSDGSQPHVYSGKVTLFRQTVSGELESVQFCRDRHSYLLATFVSNLEKTLTISPASKPLDGHLRLLHFGALPSEQVMEIFGKAFDGGKHVDDEVVGYEDIHGLRIDFDEKDWSWRRVCIDGKIVKIEEDGWLEVLKTAEGAIDLVTAS